MAWSYNDSRDFAVNQDQIGRVQVAIVAAAIAVGEEPGNKGNKGNRNEFMREVLRAPDYWAERMIWGVTNDANVQNTPEDDTVLYNAILAIWDQYSGIE